MVMRVFGKLPARKLPVTICDLASRTNSARAERSRAVERRDLEVGGKALGLLRTRLAFKDLRLDLTVNGLNDLGDFHRLRAIWAFRHGRPPRSLRQIRPKGFKQKKAPAKPEPCVSRP